MNWIHKLRLRFRALFQKEKLDARMDDEMRSHIEMQTQENIESGMKPEEARYAALRQFGWLESIKETCREQRGVSWIENLGQDIRYGARQLRKNPGFTAVAVLSLSLGIAANTTIFSFVNALLLRPPPVDAPGELWQVRRLSLKAGSPLERYQGITYSIYAYFRDQNRSFASLAAFDSEPKVVGWNRNGVGQAIQWQFVSGNFFGVCGVNMALGRPFSAEEDRQPGTAPVAVISHAFWKNSLGSDRDILGRTLTLSIRPDIGLDVRVFVFTGLVSLLTGIVFGFAPAWQGTRLNLTSALNDASRTSGAKRSRIASVLVAGQVAVSLVLLIAGALCLRSLFNAQNVPLGFKVQNRVTAELSLKDYSAEQREQFNETFIERVSALPGVESVALADFLPLDTRELALAFNVEDREPPPGQNGFVFQTLNVGPQFFTTMGTTLLQGREFAASDREGATPVAIVNRVLADKFWPGQNPIGRRLTRGSGARLKFYEIVGVVETGKYRTLGEDPRPAVFRCHLQEGVARSTFVTHVRGDPQSAISAMRQIVQALDSKLFLSRLGSLEQHLALALFPARATGLLFSVFGAAATLLAVSGLFGLIAYSVSQRTREIGVRMALGAKQSDVLRMILRQGMKLAGLGIVIGLAGAFALTRLMGALLYGIRATDPPTFFIIPLSLAAIALLACWIPARRAAKVDPMVALRYE